jgi:HlyD family secretion protein
MVKLEEAEWRLAQKTLIAPEDGVIFDTYYKEGEVVGDQQPVLSLLTPRNIRVEFFIPVERLSTLKLNQKIQFTCEGCPEGQQAQITYVSPQAEYVPPLVYSRENNDKLVFRVKATIVPPVQVRPGQPVQVSVPHEH